MAVAVLTVADWWTVAAGRPRIETWTKPAATVSIGALALVSADGRPTSVIICALIAFAFCLVGDVALLPTVDRFVEGLGAFLVGHLAFIVMFVLLGPHHLGWAVAALVGVALLAFTAGRRIITGARSTAPALMMPVTAYLVVISTMVVVGWSTRSPAAMAGSLAFVVSDAMIGWSAFVDTRRPLRLPVMVTYHAALIGLAVSLV